MSSLPTLSFPLSRATFSHHLGQAMTHLPGQGAGPTLRLLYLPDLRSWRRAAAISGLLVVFRALWWPFLCSPEQLRCSDPILQEEEGLAMTSLPWASDIVITDGQSGMAS